MPFIYRIISIKMNPVAPGHEITYQVKMEVFQPGKPKTYSAQTVISKEAVVKYKLEQMVNSTEAIRVYAECWIGSWGDTTYPEYQTSRDRALKFQFEQTYAEFLWFSYSGWFIVWNIGLSIVLSIPPCIVGALIFTILFFSFLALFITLR